MAQIKRTGQATVTGYNLLIFFERFRLQRYTTDEMAGSRSIQLKMQEQEKYVGEEGKTKKRIATTIPAKCGKIESLVQTER